MHSEGNPPSPQQYSWPLKSPKVRQRKKAETGSCSSLTWKFSVLEWIINLCALRSGIAFTHWGLIAEKGEQQMLKYVIQL